MIVAPMIFLRWRSTWQAAGRSLLVTLALVTAGTVAGMAPAQALSLPLVQTLLPYTPLPEPTELEREGAALAEEASRLAQLQVFDGALARARLAAYLAPKNPQVLRLLGALYLQSNQIDRGVAALEGALALAPADEDVLFALGSAYAQQKRYGEATQLLQKALERRPNEASGRFDLGNIYLVQGKQAEAIAQYQRAIEANPRFWEAINNLGLARYEQGDVAAALRDWEAAIALAPQSPEPNLALAAATYRQAGCQPGQRPPASDRCQASLARARTALGADERYAGIPFLRDNLWGDRLIQAVEQLFRDLSSPAQP